MVKIVQRIFVVFALLALTACVTQNYEKDSPVIENTTSKNELALTRISLGLGYLRMGNNAQAKFNFEKAKTFAPNLVEVYTAFAHYYEAVDEDALTIASYQKALSLKADDANTLNNFGVYLCRKERYEQAEEVFLQAIAVPTYLRVSESYENLSACAIKANDFSKASLYASKAVSHSPNSSSALFQMVRLEYAMGNYAVAKEYEQKYEKATRRFNPVGLALAYRVNTQLGDKQVAQNYGTMLVKMFPESWEAKQYILNGLPRIEADELADKYQKYVSKSESPKTKKRVVVLSPNKNTNASSLASYEAMKREKQAKEQAELLAEQKLVEQELAEQKAAEQQLANSALTNPASENSESVNSALTNQELTNEKQAMQPPTQVTEGVNPVAEESTTNVPSTSTQSSTSTVNPSALISATAGATAAAVSINSANSTNSANNEVATVASTSALTSESNSSTTNLTASPEENIVPLERRSLLPLEISMVEVAPEVTGVTAEDESQKTTKTLTEQELAAQEEQAAMVEQAQSTNQQSTDTVELANPVEKSGVDASQVTAAAITSAAVVETSASGAGKTTADGVANNSSYIETTPLEKPTSIEVVAQESEIASQSETIPHEETPQSESNSLQVNNVQPETKLDNSIIVEQVVEQKEVLQEVIKPEKNDVKKKKALATHKVAKGDNLYSISVKYNIKLDSLKRWNNIGKNSKIRIGDKIYLEDPKATVNLE